MALVGERYTSYSVSLKLAGGAELTVSGSSAAIHPEVRKVTPECEVCLADGGCHREWSRSPRRTDPHSRRPLSIGAVLTLTSSKQTLFIHDYFQEMHVRSVLGFIKNGRATVTEGFIARLREFNLCMRHPGVPQRGVIDCPNREKSQIHADMWRKHR